MNQDNKQAVLNDATIANICRPSIEPNRPNFIDIKVAPFKLGDKQNLAAHQYRRKLAM